jgi:hypothetical protein
LSSGRLPNLTSGVVHKIGYMLGIHTETKLIDKFWLRTLMNLVDQDNVKDLIPKVFKEDKKEDPKSEEEYYEFCGQLFFKYDENITVDETDTPELAQIIR